MTEEIDLDSIIFPYFEADIEKPQPIGNLSLRQFLRSHKRPTKEIVQLIESIKQAATDGDRELKDSLKKKLYCFTPCVNINGVRRYENITRFTGLLCLDFDKIDNAEEFKNFIFNAIPSIICAYKSPSRRGVKALVKIPICNSVEEFKSYYYGIAFHLEKYEGFDCTAANAILPLFLSYDEDLLFRPNPETWVQRGEKINEFKPYDGEIEVLENVSEEDRNTIFKILRCGLEKIEDTAHVMVRSYSLLAGGYVASGYITEEEAVIFICDTIADIPYCQKNLRGYSLTAKQMVRKGMQAPIFLE